MMTRSRGSRRENYVPVKAETGGYVSVAKSDIIPNGVLTEAETGASGASKGDVLARAVRRLLGRIPIGGDSVLGVSGLLAE